MTIIRKQRRFGRITVSGGGTATKLPLNSKVATGSGSIRLSKVLGAATSLGTAPTTNNPPVFNMPANLVLYANNVQPLSSYVTDPDGDAITLEFGSGNWYSDGAAFWTDWATGTAYKKDNVIRDAGNGLGNGVNAKYKANIDHTASASIATDATKWILLGRDLNSGADYSVPNWPPGVVIGANNTLTATAGVMPGTYGPFVIRAIDNRTNNPQRWRKIDINNATNVFNSSKHTQGAWCPAISRVVVTGGDHSRGAWGQKTEGASHTFPNGTTAPYVQGGYRADGYSFNPYGTGPLDWELEIPLFPRDLGGLTREDRPAHYDQCTFYYYPGDGKMYLMISEVRDQFCYRLNNGDPLSGHEPWGSGSGLVDGTLIPGVKIPVGRDPAYQIWTWEPDTVRNRGNGTWTRIPTTATWGGSRHARGAYDASTTSSWAFVGEQFAQLYRYNHSSGVITNYGSILGLVSPAYVSVGGSPVGFIDNFMYVTGWATDGINQTHGKNRLVMVKIDLTALIATGTIATATRTIIDLPFGGRGYSGEAWGNDSENLKLVCANRKVVVIFDWTGIPPTNVNTSHMGVRMATWNHDTSAFISMQNVPWPIMHAAGIFLPDSNEIMLYGLSDPSALAAPERGTFATFYQVP